MSGRSLSFTLGGIALAASSAIFHPVWDALWFWLGFGCYIVAVYRLVIGLLGQPIKWTK